MRKINVLDHGFVRLVSYLDVPEIFTFQVKVPIFVLRQWGNPWNLNEVMETHSKMFKEFYIPDPFIVGVVNPDDKNNRITGDDMDIKQETIIDSVIESMRTQNTRAFEVYDYLILQCIPENTASSVLPMSTYVELFCELNRGELLDFLKERLNKNVPYEVQQYAQAFYELAKDEISNELEGYSQNEKT